MRDLNKAVHLRWGDDCRSDRFCRCPSCKPPLRSRDEIVLERLKVALALGSIATTIAVLVRAFNLW